MEHFRRQAYRLRVDSAPGRGLIRSITLAVSSAIQTADNHPNIAAVLRYKITPVFVEPHGDFPRYVYATSKCLCLSKVSCTCSPAPGKMIMSSSKYHELIVTVICLAHVRLLENLHRVDPATMFVDCHVYNMHVDVWHRVRDLCATLITFGCDQSDVTPQFFAEVSDRDVTASKVPSENCGSAVLRLCGGSNTTHRMMVLMNSVLSLRPNSRNVWTNTHSAKYTDSSRDC